MFYNVFSFFDILILAERQRLDLYGILASLILSFAGLIAGLRLAATISERRPDSKSAMRMQISGLIVPATLS